MAKKASRTTKKSKSTKSAATSASAQSGAASATKKSKAARPATAAKKPSASTRRKKTAAKPASPAVRPMNGKDLASTDQPQLERDENGALTEDQLRKVKSGLSEKDLAEFRAMLMEKRSEILGDVAGMEAARAEGSSEHLSPEHMADMGSDAYEQEFTLGLMASERKLLNDIDEALQRLARGYYGVCLESGKPIPRARLEIKPWARYTIDVVRDRERRGLKV